jgi:hypothetical protein
MAAQVRFAGNSNRAIVGVLLCQQNSNFLVTQTYISTAVEGVGLLLIFGRNLHSANVGRHFGSGGRSLRPGPSKPKM